MQVLLLCMAHVLLRLKTIIKYVVNVNRHIESLAWIVNGIVLKININNIGTKIQPCFTLLAMGNDFRSSSFNVTWSSCNLTIMLRYIYGPSRHSMIFYNLCLHIKFNSIVRSTNNTYKLLFCSPDSSWSCPKKKKQYLLYL